MCEMQCKLYRESGRVTGHPRFRFLIIDSGLAVQSMKKKKGRAVARPLLKSNLTSNYSPFFFWPFLLPKPAPAPPNWGVSSLKASPLRAFQVVF
jgi:hypothetical protein